MTEAMYFDEPVEVPEEQKLVAEGDKKGVKDAQFEINSLTIKVSGPQSKQPGRSFWQVAAKPIGEHFGKATIFQTIFLPQKHEYELAQTNAADVPNNEESRKAWSDAQRNVREFNYATLALGIDRSQLAVHSKQGDVEQYLTSLFAAKKGSVFNAGVYGRMGEGPDGSPRWENNLRWHNPAKQQRAT